MKRVLLMITMISFAIVGVTVSAQADTAKGQKIYKKKMRKSCHFSGVKFARSHTQSEWESIYNEGDFAKEAKKICPRLELENIKDEWWPHVYDFALEYASDSSKVPNC